MGINFPKLEEKILERWKKEKSFEKSVQRRKKSPRFVFYEGPPTANGKPGIHHVLSRAFKDVILRYKTMRGFFVERRAGWDTHGLPVELQIEKKLGLKSKKDIEKYGIAQFNNECKQSVWEYKKEWEALTERMGFWIDLKDPYVTYETSYLETLWFIIKTFWEKGLLYKGYKVVPYCSRCGTSLSSHELAQGYQTVTENSVFVKFLISNSQFLNKSQIPSSTYFLAWTTTPWTLPGNVALAVASKVIYVLAKKNNEHYILAKSLVQKILGEHEEIKQLLGKDLIGLKYEPLFRFGEPEKKKKVWEVVPADFVSTEEGTGIVHTAVAYGVEDFDLGKKENLAMLHLVNEEGRFNNEVTPWKGMFVKDADPLIIKDLKNSGALLKEELHEHEYPFCWRCSTPLLYYAKDSWFVNMQKVKQDLIANNRKINWVPAHLKEGRMGEWLKEVKDWAFSRERYWGTPLPIWECSKCPHKEVIGSVQELKKRAGSLPHNEDGELDLHRPYIDGIVFPCSMCKIGVMQRVKEVADVWYDSGAMPFAQSHWMGGTAPKLFPADYIVEGIDQTRGWFYTLLAVSTLLGFGAPYKNVISFSHVLDDKGEKMSKSKGNVVDPWDMIKKYGIDTVRWYFYTINNPGDPKLFSEKDVQEVLRKFILTLWNSFVFYKTYVPAKSRLGNPKRDLSKNILDRWILSRFSTTAKEVTALFDAYDVTGAGRSLENFVINDLSLWYIRRSRTRFSPYGRSPAGRQNFKEASATLGYVLLQTSKLAAPFIPFLSEHIHSSLNTKGSPSTSLRASVHWEDWPFDSAAKGGLAQGRPPIDKKLEKEMELLRDLVTKALAERAKAGIKVRQPLAALKIKNLKLKIAKDLLNLLTDEVNVKEVVFDKNLKTEIELDTRITPELKEEGLLREITRSIQEMRKETGYQPSHRIFLWYAGDRELCTLISENVALLRKSVGAKTLEPKTAKKMRLDKEKEIDIEGKDLWIGIRKI